MKTIFDYEKEIISELKENEYLTIHELQKRIEIPMPRRNHNSCGALPLVICYQQTPYFSLLYRSISSIKISPTSGYSVPGPP